MGWCLLDRLSAGGCRPARGRPSFNAGHTLWEIGRSKFAVEGKRSKN